MYRHQSIAQVVAELDLVLPDEVNPDIATSAITQARQRLGQEPLAQLFALNRRAAPLADSGQEQHPVGKTGQPPNGLPGPNESLAPGAQGLPRLAFALGGQGHRDRLATWPAPHLADFLARCQTQCCRQVALVGLKGMPAAKACVCAIFCASASWSASPAIRAGPLSVLRAGALAAALFSAESWRPLAGGLGGVMIGFEEVLLLAKTPTP